MRGTSDSSDQKDCGSLNSSCAMPGGQGMLTGRKQDKFGLTQCDSHLSNFYHQGFQKSYYHFSTLFIVVISGRVSTR